MLNTFLYHCLVPEALEPEDVLTKNLYPIKARPLGYSSYINFLAILNALTRNILLKTVIQGKFFESP